MRFAAAVFLVIVSIIALPAQAADITLTSGVIVSPGESASMPLFLSNPAPVGGVFVDLSSNDPSKVRVSPAMLYIPSGLASPYAQPQVTGVNFGTAVITANAYGLTGSSQSVQVSARLFGPPSATIQKGATTNVTFALSSPAPSSLNIITSSDNPGVAGVPASIGVPANATSFSVPVTGVAGGSTIVRASSPPNIAAAAVNISVVAPLAITLGSSISLPLGLSAPFPVTLGTPAPAGGTTVTLASSDSFTVTVGPTSLYFPAGSVSPTTQAFVVAGNIGLATISASAAGYGTASQTVAVTDTITLSPQPLTIAAGSTRILSIALSGAAPSNGPITPDRGSGGFVTGLTMNLSSSNPAVASLQPTVQFYPDGSSVTTVNVVVTGVSAGTAVIHASALPFISDTTVTVIVTSTSGSGTPTSIAATSGTPQTAVVNTPFGGALTALVRDASGNPVPNVPVTFVVPASGASASFAGGVSTVLTSGAGVATSPTLTANGQPGSYSVTASVAGVAVPATYLLTNIAASSGGITLPGGVTIGTNQTLPFAVSLTTPAPAGGVTVNLSTSDASRVAISPSSVFFVGGASTPIVQPQITGVNFGSASISASAAGYTSANQLVLVGATLSFSPSSISVNGGGQQSINLLLSSPAPAGGLTVTLNSSNPGVATVPASVAFTPNSTSVSVLLSGIAAGSATLTASSGAPNVPNATVSVQVTSLADISLAAGVVVAPGDSAPIPLSLAQGAPAGGVFISLSSNDPSKVTVNPVTVFVPAGQTTPSATPQVTGVSFGSATISATAYGLNGGSQTVRVAGRLIGPPSLTVSRGTNSNLTLALSQPTPGPLVVTLSSDNSAVASVPPSVIIPANGTSAVVSVFGVSSGSTTIRASSLPNIAETTVAITVVTAANITLPSTITVALGDTVPFPITLGSPAPIGGVVVTLSSSDPATLPISPTSVYIAGGATTSMTQVYVTGNNIGSYTITASAPGYNSASQAVPVTATITLSPQTLFVPSGSFRLLSISLATAAPSVGIPITGNRGAGGFVPGLSVNLSSSNPGVAAVQPAVLFYPDGSAITLVVTQVTGGAPGTAVIRAGNPPYIPEVTATVVVQ